MWEITGAEFSKSSTHTADGISIRFPRVTRIRDDKDWKTANDLPHLKLLFENSRASTNIADLVNNDDDDNGGNDDGDDDLPSKNEEMKDETAEKPSKTESRKRKAVDTEEGSPTKKSKPACKYGSKCYQTNEDHLQRFTHPQDCESDISPRKQKILKDVFRGLTIFLSEDLEDLAKLKRYIIAYDGDLVEEFEKKSATHIVSVTKDGHTVEGSTSLVTPAWIWKCIKKGRVVPVNKFAL